MLWAGHVEKLGDFSLTVIFSSKVDNFSWRCTSVYDPTVRNFKNAFWEELREINLLPHFPWVLCGDFNAIFSRDDKLSGAPCLSDSRSAQELMHNLGLWEPPSVGKRFTWTNGQENPIWVWLDRFLVNSSWILKFPKLYQKSLPRVGSDHVPIRLEVGHHQHFKDPSALS